ncbi:MAG: hypothetical protein EZS28_008381 [Streblomastix strix]|uniref:SH3 domain-containing protein n=1 Tax=Streblomastix strix TaxID=222440 RepID=A0A5J4WMN0_9EUKA|nr:MAG: hypothetical protein EZS28_008381 [Streblomastix strix]
MGQPFTQVFYSVSINPSPNGLVAIAGDTSVKFISSDGFAQIESSSLREVTVVGLNGWGKDNTPTEAVVVLVAPKLTLLCVGPGHVGVGMNNHACVCSYSIFSDAFELVHFKIFEIKKIYLEFRLSMSIPSIYFEAIVDYNGIERDTNYISVVKGDTLLLIMKDKEYFTVERKDGRVGKVPKTRSILRE